jgi:hypothetical protein
MSEDRVLIIDDFLAEGNALLGLWTWCAVPGRRRWARAS